MRATTQELVDRLRSIRTPGNEFLVLQAASRLEDLERENARLRSALMPFADFAHGWGDHVLLDKRHVSLKTPHNGNTYDPGFGMADIGRARAALTGDPTAEKGKP